MRKKRVPLARLVTSSTRACRPEASDSPTEISINDETLQVSTTSMKKTRSEIRLFGRKIVRDNLMWRERRRRRAARRRHFLKRRYDAWQSGNMPAISAGDRRHRRRISNEAALYQAAAAGGCATAIKHDRALEHLIFLIYTKILNISAASSVPMRHRVLAAS